MYRTYKFRERIGLLCSNNLSTRLSSSFFSSPSFLYVSRTAQVFVES